MYCIVIFASMSFAPRLQAAAPDFKLKRPQACSRRATPGRTPALDVTRGCCVLAANCSTCSNGGGAGKRWAELGGGGKRRAMAAAQARDGRRRRGSALGFRGYRGCCSPADLEEGLGQRAARQRRWSLGGGGGGQEAVGAGGGGRPVGKAGGGGKERP
nr:unnamed protein product [Digitaria exilis]